MRNQIKLMRIDRSLKVSIYLGLIYGFSKIKGFDIEYFCDLDSLINEAIQIFRQREKDAIPPE